MENSSTPPFQREQHVDNNMNQDGLNGDKNHPKAQSTSFTPQTIPIDLQRLVFDKSRQNSSDPGDHLPSGSTIPDPNSVSEDGRTWQAYREGTYFLPNDALEQDRLDMQHHLYKLVLDDALFWAPLRTEPQNVLDIGTGTGIWAIDFAERYPNSNVVGMDLSLIQPTHAAPSNCSFIREDVEDNWTQDRLFDFVHLRLMVTCFNDHDAVTKKIYDHLVPGGYVEYQDAIWGIESIDGSHKGTNLEKWMLLIQEGAANLGRNFNITSTYKDRMVRTGFVDVVEHPIAMPLNSWSTDPKQREIGSITKINALGLIKALSLRILRAGLGWEEEAVNAFVELVEKDVRNKEIPWYGTHVMVYGRKPFPNEIEEVTEAMGRLE